MEWEMAGNCRLCHYQSYRHRHRSSTTNYTFFGHGCEPKCYFLMVFPPPPSPSRQLHVILSFDVFGGLMSIPCAGSSGTSHRQIVVPPPCCCSSLLLYFLLLYSFLLLLLCLCWKTNITIIILTTISGICASVERNERQNETQLETRRWAGSGEEVEGGVIQVRGIQFGIFCNSRCLCCCRCCVVCIRLALWKRFSPCCSGCPRLGSPS